MTEEPLAIVLYERLMPGSQVGNRLQDLNYRVRILNDADLLVALAEQEKPLVVLADLVSAADKVCQAIARLRANPATAHVPVIAFSTQSDPETQAAAQQAGATLLVTEAAITHHLPQLLEQALTQF
jgi:CheY-like chemotaxis protein